MDDKEYLAKFALVKVTRETAELLAGQVSTERTIWNTQHQELIKASNEAEVVKAEAEKAFMDLVLADHAVTERTKFEYGVQVKVFESIKYDEAKALFWAHENFKAAIKTSLDKPVFDAFAKHHPLPGLVEIVKTPKAMLPTKIDIPNEANGFPNLKTIETALKSPPTFEPEPSTPKDRYEPNEGGA